MKLPTKIVLIIVAVFACIALTQIDFSKEKEEKEVKEKPKSLVEVASHTDNLSTFVVALKTAGLVDTLSNGGPFTIFVPTDSAFASLPEGTFADIMEPENKERLKEILTYHTVADSIYSNDFVDGDTLKTLQGTNLHISMQGDSTLVNGTKLVKTDIKASNGVIHVINVVMGPTEQKENK